MKFRDYLRWLCYTISSAFAGVLVFFTIILVTIFAVICVAENSPEQLKTLYKQNPFLPISTIIGVIVLFWVILWFSLLFLSKRFRNAWGMVCATCQREYEWEQYSYWKQHGKCYWCTHTPKLSDSLTSASEVEEELEENAPWLETPDSTNPYAPPRTFTPARMQRPAEFIPPPDPKKAVNLSILPSLFILILFSPVLLLIAPLWHCIGVFYAIVRILGFGRPVNASLFPDWLQQAYIDIYAAQWRAHLFLTGLTGCLFALGAGMLYAFHAVFAINYTWSLGYLGVGLALAGALIITHFLPFAWKNSWVPVPSTYIVPFDSNSKAHRLVFHRSAFNASSEPPKLVFRTVSARGIVLRAYDAGAGGLLFSREFACKEESWSKLTFPLEDPLIAAVPHDQLSFVLESIDQMPWIVPALSSVIPVGTPETQVSKTTE